MHREKGEEREEEEKMNQNANAPWKWRNTDHVLSFIILVGGLLMTAAL